MVAVPAVVAVPGGRPQVVRGQACMAQSAEAPVDDRPPESPMAAAPEEAAKGERASLLGAPSLAGWRRSNPDVDVAIVKPKPRARPDTTTRRWCQCRCCSPIVCCCLLTALATVATTAVSLQPIIVETVWPVPDPPPPPPSAAPQATIRSIAGESFRLYREGNASAALAGALAELPLSLNDNDRHFVFEVLPALIACSALVVCVGLCVGRARWLRRQREFTMRFRTETAAPPCAADKRQRGVGPG